MPESASIGARLRAGLAAMLAGLSNGAHRVEEWTSRGSRSTLLVIAAVALLSLGAVLVLTEGHAVGGWFHHGPPAGERAERRPGGPPSKPEAGRPRGPEGGRFQEPGGRPQGRASAGPQAKPDGRPAEKPHGPPPPPTPPAPPAP